MRLILDLSYLWAHKNSGNVTTNLWGKSTLTLTFPIKAVLKQYQTWQPFSNQDSKCLEDRYYVLFTNNYTSYKLDNFIKT